MSLITRYDIHHLVFLVFLFVSLIVMSSSLISYMSVHHIHSCHFRQFVILSLFQSMLKTCLFHKSYLPRTAGTQAAFIHSDTMFQICYAHLVSVFVSFLLLSSLVSCGRDLSRCYTVIVISYVIAYCLCVYLKKVTVECVY